MESVTQVLTSRQKDRRRRWAAKKLKAICNKLGYRCWWCKRPVVLLRDIPQESFPFKTAHRVYWQTAEGIKGALFATVDHVEQLAHGGSNHPDNLVPACGPCNSDRSNKPLQEFARALEGRRKEALDLERAI